LNNENFRKALITFAKLYGREMDDDLMRLYWEAIKTIPDADFSKICAEIAASFKPTTACPFPTPAHFLELTGQHGDAAAQLAIAAIKTALKVVGTYQSVDFEDRAIHATVEAFGGWVALGQWDLKEWDINHARVAAYYKAAQTQDSGPDHLTGLLEAQNSGQYDKFIEPPVKVKRMLEIGPGKEVKQIGSAG